MLQRGQTDIIIALDFLVDANLPSEFLYEEDFVAIKLEGKSVYRWRNDEPLI